MGISAPRWKRHRKPLCCTARSLAFGQTVGKPREFAEGGKANAMVAKDKPQNTIRVLARMRGVRSNRDPFLIRTGNPNAWLAR
jgi:hypothetical protein